MLSKQHCYAETISSHLLSWKCQERTTREWCINPQQQQQQWWWRQYGVTFDKMLISWRHDLDVIVLGNNGCHSVALGGTVQLIACVFCSVPHKTKFMCAAVNDWVCISQKNRLIPRRQNAVSEDCVYVHVSERVCMCLYCESVLKMTEQRSPKETKIPIAITAEESSGTQAFTGTVHYNFSFSSLWLSPPISLTQEKSCHSLSTSRSLIYDYQAGSCRSETIAHQTWLPVPMEPVGNRWSLRHWTWALAPVA